MVALPPSHSLPKAAPGIAPVIDLVGGGDLAGSDDSHNLLIMPFVD